MTALSSQLPSLIAQALNTPTVRLYCDKHHADAEYFSSHSKQYLCYQCLVEEQGLTSIGEQTKKYMSDFDDIRQLTMNSIM